MKLYTGTGDRGKTSLFSGERVAKTSARIEAYGDLDELNSVIGALTAMVPQGHADIVAICRRVQSYLFQIGAWLATTEESGAAEQLTPLTGRPAQELEETIDLLGAALPPLQQFILPGGHPAAAMAHLARTVCRRSERRVIALQTQHPAPPSTDDNSGHIIVFLNRLSDLLFVVARAINHRSGTPDIPWEP
jgi:cob(I)alamin adenosyltransferase